MKSHFVILNNCTGSFYKTIKAKSFSEVYDILYNDNKDPFNYVVMTSKDYYNTFRKINEILYLYR